MSISYRQERGASAVEYAVLLAGIAAVIVVAVYGFGSKIQTKLFDDTCSTINSAVNGSPTC